MVDLKALAAPFQPDQIHWRSQSLTQDGTKALALAYLDARAVMDRLDEVCGPENWQDRYEFHGTRTVCYLSVRIGDQWVTKADGAGDSDVEAEKGGISDALKRAAVKWGIGRYLYSLPSPWVACECYEKGGKKYWKKWAQDPWTAVRNARDFMAANDAPKARTAAATPAEKPAVTLDYSGNPMDPAKHYTAKRRPRGKGQRLTDASDIAIIMDVLLANVKEKPTPEALKEWLTKQWDQVKTLPDPAFDELMDAYEDEMALINAARVVA